MGVQLGGIYLHTLSKMYFTPMITIILRYTQVFHVQVRCIVQLFWIFSQIVLLVSLFPTDIPTAGPEMISILPSGKSSGLAHHMWVLGTNCVGSPPKTHRISSWSFPAASWMVTTALCEDRGMWKIQLWILQILQWSRFGTGSGVGHCH